MPVKSAPRSTHDDRVIRILPDVLASKIAAGEVVQRPASVVKELIENSVDAGALSVQVVIKKAGSALIQVVDDGCGMSPDDASSSFARHATSKLREISDLDTLATLGFRGEALASISSVAQVELRTRRLQDEVGTAVVVDGGELVERIPSGTPAGTSIAVRNLFFNVPARRNFLKAASTEFKHIVETFQAQALSNPSLGFSLDHDGMEVYRLAASPSTTPFDEAVRLRIDGLFGAKAAGGLVAVEESTSYLSARGFVGAPELARKGGAQFLFVNGRHVKDRSLSHAVASAFGVLITPGTFPFFALYLSLDPEHIDVNVHPQKTEIKFDDERGVYGFLKAVVRRGLATAGMVVAANTDLAPSIMIPAAGKSSFAGRVEGAQSDSWSARSGGWPSRGSRGDGGGFSRGPEILGSERLDPAIFDIASFPVPPAENFRVPSRVEPAVDPAESLETQDTGSQPIWQLHEHYLLTPIRSGLLVLDQQAAHERILYERALTALEGGMAGSQQLLFPRTIDFNPAEFALIEELLPELQALGFDLEMFSGRSVLVRGVPSDVRLGAEELILEEILEQYRANAEGAQLERRENLARSLARRSAINPYRTLKPEEARGLIDQLFGCRMPYADPIGRPTMIKFSLEEFAKRFGKAGPAGAL